MPGDLYPPIPLRKLQFGPAATPPFIKLSDHGILGVKCNTFYLSKYDHCGKVRHALTPKFFDPQLREVIEQHLNCIGNLKFITNVDLSNTYVYPGHLEQLTLACPNLQRLNLLNNKNCIESLQGLHAIVCMCQDLQGLNLLKIPASSVEFYGNYCPVLRS